MMSILYRIVFSAYISHASRIHQDIARVLGDTAEVQQKQLEQNLATFLFASHPTSPSFTGRHSQRVAPSMQETPRGKFPLVRSRSDGRRTALTAGLAALVSSASAANAAEGGQWTTKKLLDEIEAGRVEKVVFSQKGTEVLVRDIANDKHQATILPEQASAIIKTLQDKGIPFNVASGNEEFGGAPQGFNPLGLIFNLAPFLILGFLSTRNMNNGGNGGMSGGPMGGMGMGGGMGQIGKAKSKIQMEPNTGVSFQDVAGCDGAKLELTEVVDFLKNPAKYQAVGAKIPRGVIMEGPPGTGKTLLARAVAGEAGVPFISASGSEFVEMFVGVGASRVRDLFGEAKKNAPCIVFIDEIDAVGRQRSSGAGGNDEREQTLNQILTEMDGFEGNSGVIVIAATNRADVLDNALIRPGRFDRRVPVDLPDVKGRQAILNVHIKGKPLADDVDIGIIAKRTIGFSGASLANLMNEAAIVTARNGKAQIGYDEIDYAIDRITVGMQKETGTNFPNRQKLVAYHEAGHAIMGLVLPDYDMVTKVTIIPRTSGAGGFTLFTPTEERLESGMYSKKFLCSQLAVALGGRVAEEIIFGKDMITTGASNDLQQVRSIARRMVAQWGFANDAMGNAPVAWEDTGGNSLLAPRVASDETEEAIDEQVKILVNCAFETTMNVLTDNRAFLDAMAEKLIAEETIDYKDLTKMRDEYAVAGEIKPLMPPQPVLS
jgi:cell division protease FtsH